MTGEPVARGLDEKVQKILDIVRIVANGAVHPGTIALANEPKTVRTLFALVNEIAEEMISKPKRIEVITQAFPTRHAPRSITGTRARSDARPPVGPARAL